MSADRGSGFSTRAVVIIIILGLLLPAVVFYWGEKTGAKAINIYVSPSGSTFTSIQAAIDAADPGDTIFIGPGEYSEQILVNEEVTLHGNGTQYCLLNTTGGSGTGIIVQANNVTIRNLNISIDDPFAKGIFAQDKQNVAIENCFITANGTNAEGILLNNGMSQSIVSNCIIDSDLVAVSLVQCSEVALIGCDLVKGQLNIISQSFKNSIENCTLQVLFLWTAHNNTFKNNVYQKISTDPALVLDSALFNYFSNEEILNGWIQLSGSHRNSFVDTKLTSPAFRCLSLTGSDFNSLRGGHYLSTGSFNAVDLINSRNMRISSAKLETTGNLAHSLFADNSQGAVLEEAILRTAGVSSDNIRMTQGSTLACRDTVFEATGASGNEVNLENGCTASAVNMSISKVTCDPTSSLYIKNYLTLDFFYENLTTPAAYVEVEVLDNTKTCYSTPFFSGADPVTDDNGTLGPFLMTDHSYIGSSTFTDNTTTVKAYRKMDFIWSEKRSLEMSSTKTEGFLIPDLIQPLRPQNVTAVVSGSGTSINVSWDPVPGDTLSYGVHTNASGTWEQIANVTETWFVHSGLSEDRIYYYRIGAWDSVHESQLSKTASNTTADVTPPETPKDLNIIVVLENSVAVGWTKVADADLAGYTFYRNATGADDTGPWVKVGDSGRDQVTYLFEELAPSTTYFFTMDAFDEVPNNSSLATPITITTSAVQIVEEFGDIPGRVFYEQDTLLEGPVEGCVVTLYDSKGAKVAARETNSSGGFLFTDVKFQDGLHLTVDPLDGDLVEDGGNRSGYLQLVTDPFDHFKDQLEVHLYLPFYEYVPPPVLAIEDFGPRGEHNGVTLSIFVKFNLSLDRESFENGILIYPPLVNMTFEWSVSNRSVRIHHDNFTYNTTYTVTVLENVVSANGLGFAKGYDDQRTWTFTTRERTVYTGNGGGESGGIDLLYVLLFEIIGFIGLIAIAIGLTVTLVRRHNRKIFLEEMRRIASQKSAAKPVYKTVAGKKEMVYSYYEFIGVDRDATDKEIKKAYRKMSKMFHPDKYGSHLTEDELKGLKKSQIKLNHAKECLLHPRKRVLYDIHIGHKLKGEVEVPPEEKQDEFDHEYGGEEDDYDDDWDIDIDLDSDDYVDELPELEVLEDAAQDIDIPDVSAEELPEIEDLGISEDDVAEPDGVDPGEDADEEMGYSLPED